jgi:drug/metabolite transporter (DMT)-like permease
MMGYVFIALTVLLTGYGQIILKYEINSVASIPSGWPMIGFLLKFMLFRPLVLSGFFSGLLAAFTWMAALSKFELSYAYPFMSLNFVFVVALSFLLFGEGMHIYKLIGLALICLGVLFVGNAPTALERPRQAVQSAATSTKATCGLKREDAPVGEGTGQNSSFMCHARRQPFEDRRIGTGYEPLGVRILD